MAKQDLIVKEQAVLSSDPSAPAAGYSKIYPKSDGNWYVIDSAGTITLLGIAPPSNTMIQLFKISNFT